MKQQKVEIGVTATDRVTGMCGVLTAKCEYITGCTQFFLQAQCKPDGTFVEGRWFDEDRLTVLEGREKLVIPVTKSTGFGEPPPGR